MKQIWQGRMLLAAAKYGDAAPTATACCNACRTCVTTNVTTLALGIVSAAGIRLAHLVKRSA